MTALSFDAALARFPRERAMWIDGCQGTIWVNTFMDGAAELPSGGFKQSGAGRELGRNAVNDYTEEKTLHIHNGPRTGWWLPRPGGAGANNQEPTASGYGAGPDPAGSETLEGSQ